MTIRKRILDMLANPGVYGLVNETVTKGKFHSHGWYNVTEISLRLDIDRDDFGFRGSDKFLEFEEGGSRVRLNDEQYQKLTPWKNQGRR